MSNNKGSDAERFIMQFEFLSLLIRFLLIVFIYISIDEYIFSGLGLLSTRTSPEYYSAKDLILTGLSFSLLFTVIDFLVLTSGMTFNYTTVNLISKFKYICYHIIDLLLTIFGNVITVYFYIDSWHYVTIWYIFIVSM